MESQSEARDQAIKRLEAKRAFLRHAATYVVVNLFLIFIWAVPSGGGYFWPIWPILGWGIGLAFHAWGTFFERPISESAIQREIDRSRSSNN